MEDGEIIFDDAPKNNTTRNIIIVVAIVLLLLCCCCTALGVSLYFMGDTLDGVMRELGVMHGGSQTAMLLA